MGVKELKRMKEVFNGGLDGSGKRQAEGIQSEKG